MLFKLFLMLSVLHVGNFAVAGARKLKVNIARHKPAFSSSFWRRPPKHGNDGREDEDRPLKLLSRNKCSWTTSRYGDRKPFWAVDLGRTHAATSVSVLHTTSHGRPANLIIEMFADRNEISNIKASGKLCVNATGRLTAKFFTSCTSDATGRFLRVKKFKTRHRRDVLSVCEYFVHGYPVTDEAPPTKLPSLFSCSKRINETKRNANEEFCSCFCRLPYKTFPNKFKKWVDGIEAQCRKSN